MKTTKAYFSPSAVMHPPYALNGVRGTQAQGSLGRLLQHYARRRTPTEADASASLVQQGRQLGDVARYAPRFILSQHLRHVSVVRIFARIDIRERLAVGIADFKATGYRLDVHGTGYRLDVHGGGNRRMALIPYGKICYVTRYGLGLTWGGGD